MYVHDSWAQNRQATAACDFCNRKNIPLQKCQDCHINICKKCTSKGSLEKDPRHMLAGHAAESFDWHEWGKGQKTRSLTSIRKILPTPRIVTPEPETSIRPVPSQPLEGYLGGYPHPFGNPHYPSAPYKYPMPMGYHQQCTGSVSGLKPVDIIPPFACNHQVPQYAYSPPPYGIHAWPAGHPFYNSHDPQQSTFGAYSHRNSHLSAEQPSTTKIIPTRSSKDIPAHSEGVQALSQVPFVPSATQFSKVSDPTPVTANMSIKGNRNTSSMTTGSSTEPVDTQHPRYSLHKQLITQSRVESSELPFISLESTQKPRQTLKPRAQGIKGLKRPRDGFQGSGLARSKKVSDSTHQIDEETRRETTPRPLGRQPCTMSTGRVLKRPLQVSEDDDVDEPRGSPAKKSRRIYGPDTRIIKISVKSSAGVQRLREILGTSQALSRCGPAVQNDSQSRSSFSSEELKKTHLDELLDVAGVQPAPWSGPDPPPQIRDKEPSHQLSPKPGKLADQNGSSGGFTQDLHIGDKGDADEVQEAAMILLNMRHDC